MSDQGWIKLYRKLIHDPVFSTEKGLKVWVWVLLKANHKKVDLFWGRQNITLRGGQLIFGRYTASEELKMSPSTVWFWMNELKKGEYIDIKTTNKFSIVTIKNWDKYQSLLTTNNQQVNTVNNVKNVKNNDEISDEISNIKKLLSSTGIDEPMLERIVTDDKFLKEKQKQIIKCLEDENIKSKAAYIVSMYQFWRDYENK